MIRCVRCVWTRRESGEESRSQLERPEGGGGGDSWTAGYNLGSLLLKVKVSPNIRDGGSPAAVETAGRVQRDRKTTEDLS